jgi:hypothetical protein
MFCFLACKYFIPLFILSLFACFGFVLLKLNEEASKHYIKLHNKINNLTKQLKYKENTTNKQTFYLRLRSMTTVQLFEMEETLLNKGGKYNMGVTPKSAQTISIRNGKRDKTGKHQSTRVH